MVITQTSDAPYYCKGIRDRIHHFFVFLGLFSHMRGSSMIPHPKNRLQPKSRWLTSMPTWPQVYKDNSFAPKKDRYPDDFSVKEPRHSEWFSVEIGPPVSQHPGLIRKHDLMCKTRWLQYTFNYENTHGARTMSGGIHSSSSEPSRSPGSQNTMATTNISPPCPNTETGGSIDELCTGNLLVVGWLLDLRTYRLHRTPFPANVFIASAAAVVTTLAGAHDLNVYYVFRRY